METDIPSQGGDAFPLRRDREKAEIADIQIPVICHDRCRNNMSEVERKIEDFLRFAVGRCCRDCSMVGFNGEKSALVSDHAVRNSIRLKVGGIWIGGGMFHVEQAQVRDVIPSAVAQVHLHNAVGQIGISVGAPSPANEGVKLAIEKSNICDADNVALHCYKRRQAGSEGRQRAIGRQLRYPGAGTSFIRSDWRAAPYEAVGGLLAEGDVESNAARTR